MELKDIRTKNDLIEYIQDNIPKDKLTAETPEAQADWFVAWAEAKSMIDSYSTKDLASALLGGIPAIHDNREYIPEWLETFFVDADEEIDPEMSKVYLDEAVESLESLLNEHFGIYGV